MSDLNALRDAIRAAHRADEPAAVLALADEAHGVLGDDEREAVLKHARRVVERCREAAHGTGTLDVFLQEFGLSNREGVALMCLAEALLRIPDEATADRLIAEKIRAGDWGAHRGKSDSGFVNASVWGLMLTGRLVALDGDTQSDPGASMRRLAGMSGIAPSGPGPHSQTTKLAFSATGVNV